MSEIAQMPQNFTWEGPPVMLPVRAIGGVVMDARRQTVANCPNGALADVVAYSINVANGVHPPTD
jgi:hypothetical protein